MILVPRARTVPPELLMEQLFRQTELEVRLPLNLNVLDAEGVPWVMGLAQVLRAFLEHRMVVLIRRSRYRLAQIEERIEVLAAYRIAYLNLDEVIRIIREEDEPGRWAELMRAFALTERQAEAILNMRLRHLRRLEEQTLLKEQRLLKAERREIKGLLQDEEGRRARLREEIEEIGRRSAGGPLGRRRTGARRGARDRGRRPRGAGRTPTGDRGVLAPGLDPRAARARGRRRGSEIQGGRCAALPAARPEHHRLLADRSDGRGYLLPVERLPGGRGQGAPLRLQIDLAHGAGAGHARDPSLGRPGPARLQQRARLRRRGAGDRGADPERQAGVQSRARRTAGGRPAHGGRSRCHDRKQPCCCCSRSTSCR